MNDPCSLPRFESVLRPPTLKRYHVQRKVSPLKNHLRLCSRLSPSQPHRLNATGNDEAVNKQLIFNPYEDLVRGKHFICTECGKCCTGAGNLRAFLCFEHVSEPCTGGQTLFLNKSSNWQFLLNFMNSSRNTVKATDDGSRQSSCCR